MKSAVHCKSQHVAKVMELYGGMCRTACALMGQKKKEKKMKKKKKKQPHKVGTLTRSHVTKRS